jgi:serine/threonine protein kinase
MYIALNSFLSYPLASFFNMESGTELGHYEILSPIGKGRMGEVWKAKDTKLGREVGIKTLPEEFARTETVLHSLRVMPKAASVC